MKRENSLHRTFNIRKDTLNTSNISTNNRNESRSIKRVDHKDMKRRNKEFEKAYWDATQNREGPQPKLGLTPINKRNFKIWRLVLHVAAEECYCVWTDCSRVDVEQHCVETLIKNDTTLKGKKGTLNNASHATKNYYATTRTTPCSTRPSLFTQAQASTTSTSPVVKVHQLHIYNNHNNIP